ncbi:alpha/beta hydrolase [Kaistella palustris]|uniref:alpha/beta hydrolase n=1 Tax=Kaistella palustris TaxID=493376 RepID=UPI00040A80E9|nr:alpha/beta hydrolase-fold protein [Kaistella palustris]
MKALFSSLTFLLFLMSCRSAAPVQDIIPAHDTFILESKYTGETRVINVWKPENYNSDTGRFPVLYMPDGGLKEDFPHIANTLSKLISAKEIPPIILVGIENTQRRRDLTGPTQNAEDKKIAPVVGGSKEFRAFIKEELFPVIEKKYRTGDRRGLIGESLAGLFVTETLLESPNMFDYYIAFDPSLWWNDHALVGSAEKDLAGFPTAEKRFWFAGSGTEEISKYPRELAKILKERNLPNLKWKYSPEPKEEHSTIFRATKEKALIWTFANQ